MENKTDEELVKHIIQKEKEEMISFLKKEAEKNKQKEVVNLLTNFIEVCRELPEFKELEKNAQGFLPLHWEAIISILKHTGKTYKRVLETDEWVEING